MSYILSSNDKTASANERRRFIYIYTKKGLGVYLVFPSSIIYEEALCVIQPSAVKTRSNITRNCIHIIAETEAEYISQFEPTKYIPYLALTDLLGFWIKLTAL